MNTPLSLVFPKPIWNRSPNPIQAANLSAPVISYWRSGNYNIGAVPDPQTNFATFPIATPITTRRLSVLPLAFPTSYTGNVS